MPFAVDLNLIQEAENQLGRRLPADLRVRLSRSNGGEIGVSGDSWTIFPVWDPTNRKTMIRTSNHIIRENASARKWPGFPQEAIAIATNGSGDFLISRAEDDFIEIWDHETGQMEPVEIDWY